MHPKYTPLQTAEQLRYRVESFIIRAFGYGSPTHQDYVQAWHYGTDMQKCRLVVSWMRKISVAERNGVKFERTG